MKQMVNFLFDILKCLILALIISLVILSISGAIYFLLYKGDLMGILNSVKRANYTIGIVGLFLSSGFFVQRNATRPLVYHEEWRNHFKFFNLGFVIMFISLFVCSFGMVAQNFYEKMGGM